MFFKKKKEKTPKTSNRKVVPNMKPIEELRTNKDIAEWCRDFFRVTDSLCPDGCSEKSILVRPERNLLMALQTIPSTMSSMMTMTISPPFHSQKPSKLERKETI